VADSLTTFNPFENSEASPIGTGRRSQYGAQVSGGASQFTYFLSGEFEEETGFLRMPDAEEQRVRVERGGAPVPDEQRRPNALERVSLRGNARAVIAENADVTLSTGFVSSDIRIPSNAIFQGGYWGSGNPAAPTRWLGGAAPGEIFAIRNAESVNHFTGSLAANWRPTAWLTTRGSVGIDFSTNALDALQRRGEGPPGPNRNGRRQNVRTEVDLYSADVGASVFFDLTPRLGSRTSAGGQFNRRVQQVTIATGTNLPPGSETVTGAAVITGSEFFSESVVAGAYVEQTVDLDRRLYLTGGLRADGASGFGRSFRTAFYPKASASWLALETPAGALNSLRLRLAFGASGVQPGSTDALSLIGLAPVIVNGAAATGATQIAFGDQNLKPERQTEFEAGADAEFFGSRLRMEATYYDRLSRDALIDRPLPTSFGVASRRENIGSVRNRGVEGLVTALLIDRPRLGWDVSVNGSVNKNRLERLADDVPFINHASTIQSREGHPLFGFWFRPILGFGDANGNGIIEPNEVQVGDTAVFSGTSLPTRQLTASTALSLFGNRLRVATQFDYRGGFKQFNNNELVRCAFANCAAVNDPRASLAAQAAIVAATTPSLGRTFHGYAVDGEFVRWRELSLTYAAPAAFSRRLGAESLTVTLTGRNLHLFSGYGGIDPEVNAFPGITTVEGFADLATAPPPRYWMLRLNLGL
ncbi:MAG: TonB-dependent receptor domain-containing protein, partial [Gemmatimonadaceae bacterium]